MTLEMLEMTNCPVCGMPVDVTISTPAPRHVGEPYYFCSESCKHVFDRKPEKYLQS